MIFGGEWDLDTSGGGVGCEVCLSEDGVDVYDLIICYCIVVLVMGVYFVFFVV